MKTEHIVLICFVFTALLSPRHACLAAVEGDVGLLRQLATTNRENRERLKTWQGTAEIKDEYVGGLGTRSQLQTVTFLDDRETPALRWQTQIHGEVEVKAPTSEPAVSKERHFSGMVKGDAFFKLETFKSVATSGSQARLTIQPAEKGEPRMGPDNFDPVHFMDMAEPNVPKRLTFFADNAAVFTNRWLISRDGNQITVQLAPGSSTSCCYVFDLGKGGSLISYAAKDAFAEDQYDFHYEQKNEVWLVTEMTYVNRASENGRVRTLTRNIRFTKSEVNRPIAVEEFSLEELGVKSGDLVSDERAHIQYKYKTDVKHESDRGEGDPAN